jgi:hypothetical protein
MSALWSEGFVRYEWEADRRLCRSSTPGSVSARASDPFKWFPFDTLAPLSGPATPDPVLGVAGSVRRRVPSV